MGCVLGAMYNLEVRSWGLWVTTFWLCGCNLSEMELLGRMMSVQIWVKRKSPLNQYFGRLFPGAPVSGFNS